MCIFGKLWCGENTLERRWELKHMLTFSKHPDIQLPTIFFILIKILFLTAKWWWENLPIACMVFMYPILIYCGYCICFHVFFVILVPITKHASGNHSDPYDKSIMYTYLQRCKPSNTHIQKYSSHQHNHTIHYSGTYECNMRVSMRYTIYIKEVLGKR